MQNINTNIPSKILTNQFIALDLPVPGLPNNTVLNLNVMFVPSGHCPFTS